LAIFFPEKTMTEIFYEFRRVGDIVRVAAIDAETGTEVVIQGPAKAGKKGLQMLAHKKLLYVLNKEKKGAKNES
jgi:hypothetical protein